MSYNVDHLKGEVNVIIRQTCKPGKGEEVFSCLEGIKRAAAGFGCLRFDVQRQGDKFVITERYKDAAGIRGLMASDTFKQMKARVADSLVPGSHSAEFTEAK